jgi:hypothetical protein
MSNLLNVCPKNRLEMLFSEGAKMSKSVSVVDAIDKLRDSMGSIGTGQYEYPWIANGPAEKVLAFNNNEHIRLVVNGEELHFSSEGILTDLHHNDIPGSRVETTFPVKPADFVNTTKWPPKQEEPWNGPPVKDENTTGNGYSKQAYFFNNKADGLITVGPSLPKITPIAGGGSAQFWVGSIGVITQGIGKYEGVRGMSVYIGSAYLPDWPTDLKNPKTQSRQLEILQKGFSARIGTYFKFVP